MLLDIMTRIQPATQEDWKAVYWMICWGRKPSEVGEVIIHMDKERKLAYIWGEDKNEK